MLTNYPRSNRGGGATPGGGLTGTLTQNTIPKAGLTGTLGDSAITDDGTQVTITSRYLDLDGNQGTAPAGTVGLSRLTSGLALWTANTSTGFLFGNGSTFYGKLNAAGLLVGAIGSGDVPSRRLHVLDGGGDPQMRLGYDAINYLDITVGNAGAVNLNTVTTSGQSSISRNGTLRVGWNSNGVQLYGGTTQVVSTATSRIELAVPLELSNAGVDPVRTPAAGKCLLYWNGTDLIRRLDDDSESVVGGGGGLGGGLATPEDGHLEFTVGKTVAPGAGFTGLTRTATHLDVYAGGFLYFRPAGGALGIMTSSGFALGTAGAGPGRMLHVQDGGGNAQMRLAYNSTNYVEFQATSTGDLNILSTTAGFDITLPSGQNKIISDSHVTLQAGSVHSLLFTAGGALRMRMGTGGIGFNGAAEVAQGAAIADATDAASTQAALNTLLAYLRSRGDIAA